MPRNWWNYSSIGCEYELLDAGSTEVMLCPLSGNDVHSMTLSYKCGKSQISILYTESTSSWKIGKLECHDLLSCKMVIHYLLRLLNIFVDTKLLWIKMFGLNTCSLLKVAKGVPQSWVTHVTSPSPLMFSKVNSWTSGWVSCDKWHVVNHPCATAIWQFWIGCYILILHPVSFVVDQLICVPCPFDFSCSI